MQKDYLKMLTVKKNPESIKNVDNLLKHDATTTKFSFFGT